MTTPTPALTALLDELDRLRAAATPGPWNAATAPAEGSDETHAEYLANGLRPDEGRPLWVAWAEPADIHDADDVEYVVPVVTGDGPASEANARYIAAVHAAVPRLIAAVRAALALADQLAAEHRGMVVIDRHVAATRIRDALTDALEGETDD